MSEEYAFIYLQQDLSDSQANVLINELTRVCNSHHYVEIDLMLAGYPPRKAIRLTYWVDDDDEDEDADWLERIEG